MYEQAHKGSTDDPRGELKVLGALAACRYMVLEEKAGEAAEALISEMEKVARQAESAGYDDVAQKAGANLELMRDGTDDWRVFENE